MAAIGRKAAETKQSFSFVQTAIRERDALRLYTARAHTQISSPRTARARSAKITLASKTTAKPRSTNFAIIRRTPVGLRAISIAVTPNRFHGSSFEAVQLTLPGQLYVFDSPWRTNYLSQNATEGCSICSAVTQMRLGWQMDARTRFWIASGLESLQSTQPY
jgi:hypothetical protein